MIPAVTLVLVALGAFATDRWGRPGTVLLAPASLVWLAVNKPVEGPVLIPLTPTHGLATADLIGLAGLAFAAVVVVRGERRA